MISVKNLCKEFDGRTVLNNISIDYKEGECSLIIGASGSGKTVLLKNLVGLHTPDKGEIWYDDKQFTTLNEEKLERANFCLKRVNLENANKKFPNELSGGMQKRVGIARAIALNPKYLFCDEPNSGLDPTTSIVIDHLIQEITQEYNITTIINTHDMNSVMEIGDKIGFIYKGEKLWEGSNKEILLSDCEELNDFVFASNMAEQLRAFMK